MRPQATATKPEMERCLEVVLARDEQLAERIVRLDGMTACLDTRFPQVWDASYLRLDRPGLRLETVLAAAEETIGAAGFGHRTIAALDQADGERLAAELAPRGWRVERDVYMVCRRDPDRAASAPVEEVGQDEVDEVRRTLLREDLAEWFGAANVSEAMVEQYLAYERVVGEVAGDRWFAVRDEGRIVSLCRLLAGEGAGQVEDVGTVPDARGRGLARAVVLAAVEASRAAGDEITFLIALADDWPQKLYRRLGFDPVGGDVGLFRAPPTDGGATPASAAT